MNSQNLSSSPNTHSLTHSLNQSITSSSRTSRQTEPQLPRLSRDPWCPPSSPPAYRKLLQEASTSWRVIPIAAAAFGCTRAGRPGGGTRSWQSRGRRSAGTFPGQTRAPEMHLWEEHGAQKPRLLVRPAAGAVPKAVQRHGDRDRVARGVQDPLPPLGGEARDLRLQVTKELLPLRPGRSAQPREPSDRRVMATSSSGDMEALPG